LVWIFFWCRSPAFEEGLLLGWRLPAIAEGETLLLPERKDVFDFIVRNPSPLDTNGMESI
jgi:hypothetical protein